MASDEASISRSALFTMQPHFLENRKLKNSYDLFDMMVVPVFVVLAFQSKLSYAILLIFEYKYLVIHISATLDNHYSPLMC